MKLPIYAPDKKESGTVELPSQFLEPVRGDLIKRAALAVRNSARQAYGAKIGAGMRHSAEVSKRRRDYRGSYGHGISRVPRKVLSRRGTRMNWVGAEAPGMRGGRRAHPPKSDKIWETKVNKKENRKAIRSAIAATIKKDLVAIRGHKLPTHYPFIINDTFETLTKTKDLQTALRALGFTDEIIRVHTTSIRAGRGKLRGRKTKTKVGPLFVVSRDCDLTKAARNLLGVDVVRVDALNCDILAPGTHPGRLTLFTESAIKRLKDENLYMENHVKVDHAGQDTTAATAVQDVKDMAKNKTAPKTAPAKTAPKAAGTKPVKAPSKTAPAEASAKTEKKTKTP